MWSINEANKCQVIGIGTELHEIQLGTQEKIKYGEEKVTDAAKYFYKITFHQWDNIT